MLSSFFTARNGLTMALLGLIASVIAAFSLPSASSPIPLPIKVYPADGISEHVESITLTVDNPSGVDRLYVKAHQPFYHVGGTVVGEWEGFDVEGAASIKVNSTGSWIDVRNSNVTCAAPEKHYGCIGGGPATVRFSIPVSNVVSGENTISFRFNGTAGIRSGYRVLGAGFMRSSDDLQTFDPLQDGAHDGSVFTYTDYSSWSAPDGYDTASDVDAGRDLFTQRDILVERISGSPEAITASCADCHAKDGSDLWYFNFSNESIIARSRFHSLTEEQGKQIAAYIRSIQLKTAEGATYDAPGTPWNPPFQPGRTYGLSNADVPLTDSESHLWAAGAGLDEVLSHDREMVKYLWPKNGDPDQGIGFRTNSTTNNKQLAWHPYRTDGPTIDLTRYPIAVQFPDWNNWLPDVSPIDHGKGGFESTEAWTAFIDFAGSRDASWSQSSLEGFDLAGNPTHRRYAADKFGKLYRGTDRYTGKNAGSAYGLKEDLGVTLWGMVRMWSVFQQYDLYDHADEVFDVYNLDDSNDELFSSWDHPIGMWTKGRHFFDAAPHLIGGNRDEPFLYGSLIGSKYYTHVWYHLQTVVDPGVFPGYSVGNPVDWQYQDGHMGELCKVSNQPAPTRMFTSEILRLQLFYTEGIELSPDRNSSPWSNRRVHPKHTQPLHWLGAYRPSYRNSWCWEDWTDSELKEDIVTAGMRAWWAMYSSLPISDFQARQCDDWDVCWEPSSHVPSLSSGTTYEGIKADRFYQEIPMLRDNGIPRGLLDSISTQWAAPLWPKGGDSAVMGSDPTWEELVDYDPSQTTGNTAPSISLTSPTNGDAFTAPASLSLAADASDSDGSISTVTFYAGDTQVAEVSSAPYEATWSDVAAGSYTLTAQATDDAGATTTSASVTVTVSAPTSESNGLSYSYYEGDWTQLPDFGSLTAVSTGTTSDISTAVRERDDLFGLRFVGYVEISSSGTGTYTFYTTSDDGSRLLVNGQEIVINDGVHAAEEASGSVDLSAGWHKITVEYFEQEGGEELSASWKGPSLSKQEIPPSRLFLSPGTSQQISLNAGWNLISSRLVPSNKDMSTLFADVESDLVIVQDQQGDRYEPTATSNSLETWDSSEGYRVYMSSTQTLLVEGETVSSTTLDLSAGWNLIPFYPDTEMSVQDAFASINGTVEIVKDTEGNSYIPARNLDEIGVLKPGQAYKVYVNEATSFSYP
jgi:cytochrome c553